MQLSDNWLTEGLMDREYKEYVLLAYLQDVQEAFANHRLYPFLSDIQRNIEYIKELKSGIDHLSSQFPKRITAVDWELVKAHYERLVPHDETLELLEELIAFSLPKLEEKAKEGHELFDEVEEGLILEPVGLSPLHKESGYLFLQEGEGRETEVYRFILGFLVIEEERFRSMEFSYVEQYLASPFERISTLKLHLIRKYPEWPNPVTYLAKIEKAYPKKDTLLPIAKRKLLRELAAA
jgi:hypothetical protein